MIVAVTASKYTYSAIPKEIRIVRNPFKRKLTENEVHQFLSEQKPVGLIAGVEPLTYKVLSALKELKVISRLGAGLDSVDLEACRQLDIRVFNTPDAPVASVSEHATALMFALTKNLSAADHSVKSGKWEKPASSLIARKTVGIIGCGRIGSHFGKLCASMGCHVTGYDTSVSTHPCFEMVSLDTLLRKSDVVSVHLPRVETTRNFISKVELALMKPSSILINTSRGSIVNEGDLVTAISEGWIGGAGLDVFSQEPYSGPLCELGNKVLLTPHMASSTTEGRAEMEREAWNNLITGLRKAGVM